jgi:hypothetical protein
MKTTDSLKVDEIGALEEVIKKLKAENEEF